MHMHIIYTTSHAYYSREYLWYYDILVVVVLNELVYMLLESSYAYAYIYLLSLMYYYSRVVATSS